MKYELNWVYRFARFSVHMLSLIWFRYERYGQEHIPAEGGCIIAANHASFLDPPMVAVAILPRPIRFLARDSLFQASRFAHWLFTKFLCVPLDRTKGDIAAIRAALNILKEGWALGLFPEGTRSLDGRLQPAKGGIGFLVAKARVPVVPVYLDGTYASFPKHAKFIKPRKVRVFFGEPIMPEEIAALGKGRGVYQQVGELVMSRIAALNPRSQEPESK